MIISRKKLAYQQELVKALKEARIANDAKQNSFGKCPNDIRTPINGIMGMLDIEEKKLGCSRKIERMP